jgi:hypothetical protein
MSTDGGRPRSLRSDSRIGGNSLTWWSSLRGQWTSMAWGRSEIFIFTDNMTSEAAFWKGLPSPPLLFNLVLRLRQRKMDHNLILHVVHVWGKRMIDQRTDGLSQADHSTGAVTGRDIRHWVPLNRGAVARSPVLGTWLDFTTQSLGFQILLPAGWSMEGHGYGNYIWTPPPAVVDVVVEQLGKARLKRPESMHLRNRCT